MKLADYIADFLAKQKVRHVFLVSGGAAVHMIDSIAKHPKLNIICSQHEENGAASADGYARITGNIGVMVTTSGPGATNLVTSVCDSYFDSIPVLYLTGQVATFRLKPNKTLRQKGFQETDVVSIFKSITKYAQQLKSAQDIRYELEKALYLAKEGRPGPVLLDIPDDLQREAIEPHKLKPFTPRVIKRTSLKQKIDSVYALLKKSERPVLILGAGIRIGKAELKALTFARHFKFPTLLTWGALDLMPFDDPLNMGSLGVCGPRAGNFAAQKSDLVLAIGSRLSQMITGGKQNLFAPNAKKIMVDIDKEELNKFSRNEVILNLKIQADVNQFFDDFMPHFRKPWKDTWQDWRNLILYWKQKYPICLPKYYDRNNLVDAHVFIKELSRYAKEGDIILTDAGGNLSWTMQAFEIKKGQRLFSAWNHSPMGYSMPAAIGAALASHQEIFCVIGDGGLMMCLQELGTVTRNNLPIKIFIFNNHGHGIQKQTLDTWLNSRYVAVDEPSGLWFPDFKKLAATFSLPYVSINNHKQIRSKLHQIGRIRGPVLCNVEIVPNQKIVPMLRFGAGLEDLDPKLPPQEIENILKYS